MRSSSGRCRQPPEQKQETNLIVRGLMIDEGDTKNEGVETGTDSTVRFEPKILVTFLHLLTKQGTKSKLCIMTYRVQERIDH